MRVVHLNATDSGGGAARSALRLHESLRSAGVDSTLLVRCAAGRAPGVIEHRSLAGRAFPRLRDRLDSLPWRRYASRDPALFSSNVVPDRIPAAVRALGPSLVNLHWIGRGFMRIESLPRLRGPLVWTIHDSWPFTGGCHVPQGCDRFTVGCGACPALGSGRERDLSRKVWERKARAWSDLPLTLVAPSRWMATRAAASALFRSRRVEVIPNGIDTSVFRPSDPGAARARWGLPSDGATVLFAAMWAESDRNKGFHLLAPALAQVRLRGGARPHLLIAGSSTLHRHPDLTGVPARSLGELREEREMASAIAAADVVAVPSMQENFPNAVLEALACGRPVVAFDVGGMPDLVLPGTTGALVRPYDVRELAEAMRSILADPARAAEMGRNGRRLVEGRLDLAAQARRYLDLYADLLPRGRPR
jgi:glycosyltransferase involved in cell wall biosynthesis